MTDLDKFKLIERTSKFDAYQSVHMWLDSSKAEHKVGDAQWFAKEKMKGHLAFLRNHAFRYAYSEGFIPNDGYYGVPENE